MVRHVRDRLAEYLPAAHLVADRADRYADLDLPALADHRTGLGPLGGLEAALRHGRASSADDPPSAFILVAAVDMPDITTAILDRLLVATTEAESPPPHAIAFRDPTALGGRWHPFPGLYATSLLADVGARLDRGERSLQALLDAVRARALALPRPEDWPAPDRINTPEDLVARNQRLRDDHEGT